MSEHVEALHIMERAQEMAHIHDHREATLSLGAIRIVLNALRDVDPGEAVEPDRRDSLDRKGESSRDKSESAVSPEPVGQPSGKRIEGGGDWYGYTFEFDPDDPDSIDPAKLGGGRATLILHEEPDDG